MVKFLPDYLQDVSNEEHKVDDKPTIVKDDIQFDQLRPLSEIKLKDESELPQLVPISDYRLPYIKKLNSLREKNVCILCGEEIKLSQEISFWLNVYPAHLDCIHAELNRIAKNEGEPLPFLDQ